MHHLEIEAEEKRQAKLTADVRERAIQIRKARAQAELDNLRRREPVVDDYNAPTSHANRQTTEFQRTPEGEVALEKLSQRFRQALDDMDDTVNRPAHYAQQGQIECIDVLEQLAEDGHDFRILNAIKYLWRYRHKGGYESLQKAQWYIDRVLEFPNDE